MVPSAHGVTMHGSIRMQLPFAIPSGSLRLIASYVRLQCVSPDCGA